MKKSVLQGSCVFLIFFIAIISASQGILKCRVKAANNFRVPREVFLTFDDGPSPNNTGRIIDILNKKNVKATFFVIGSNCKQNFSTLKKISDSGMSIGVHTYSHVYKEMYRNLNSYLRDFEMCREVIKNMISQEPVDFVRMPGGSDNMTVDVASLDRIKYNLKKRGLKYVDWNVVSGDADAKYVSADYIKNNVIQGCANKRIAVVLMHDSYYKTTTVEALPYIIDSLKEQGFVFKTFDNISKSDESAMINMGIINR